MAGAMATGTAGATTAGTTVVAMAGMALGAVAGGNHLIHDGIVGRPISYLDRAVSDSSAKIIHYLIDQGNLSCLKNH